MMKWLIAVTLALGLGYNCWMRSAFPRGGRFYRWRWISSMTREDTGGGACEVIFVQDLEVL